MEQIGDLLGRYKPQEPPEITAIKRYISDEFGAAASVAVRDNQLIVTVQNGALAATLRLRSPQIQAQCHIDKRLIFRIG